MIRIVSVLAVAPSQDRADDMRSAFSAIAGVRVEARVAPLAAFAAAPAEAPTRVLAVDCRADSVEDRKTLARLAAPGAPPVIAVVRGATVTDVRELMRLGVTDVVPWPIDTTDLEAALEHARARLANLPQSRGHVLPFLGCCGGSGSTTLAVQTALDLLQHDRKRPAKVCLLDLDLQFGNAGLSLDLPAGSGLGQVIEAAARLDPALLASAMARHESGLDVLSAPGEIIPFEALDVPTVEHILAFTREQYDYVVVDLPRAWTNWTPAVLAASSLAAVVLQPTVSGVQRARNHLKVIADERLDALPRLLVANKIDRGWGSGWHQCIREAEKLLGHEIAATVRRDDDTALTARETGRTLRSVKRNSVIEKDVHALAERMLTLLAPDAGQQPAAKPAVSAGAMLPFLSLKTAR